MQITSFSDFKRNARPGVRFPLAAEMVLDLHTPLSVYQSFQKEKFRFLLESSEGGEKWGRYSFIGVFPSLIFKSQGRNIELIKAGKKTRKDSRDPLSLLKDTLQRYRFIADSSPPPLVGGAVGLISYEMVRFFEELPDKKVEGVSAPDLYFMVPQILLVVDNLKQTLKIFYDARIDTAADVKKEYQRGTRLIQKVKNVILKSKAKNPETKLHSKKLRWTASLTEAEHARGVENIREYIAAGDITQAVFSIRFQARQKVNDFDLYRMVRRINPSPYLFHLHFNDVALVGASPETLVRVEDGEMTLRPIAGTRPRGADEKEDKKMETELLEDEKEKAEHIMLVDLGRNDLGRVAVPGTVKVDELMKVERYSHVMHLVSQVRARLLPGKDAFDVLRATFPAGTLSGSPKIRAMEIIEELEPVHRSFYGGCVGYFSFSGNMDMAITIRSALLKDGVVTIQAGGGIVADSVPSKEYEEVMNKSKAMKKAVEHVARHR